MMCTAHDVKCALLEMSRTLERARKQCRPGDSPHNPSYCHKRGHNPTATWRYRAMRNSSFSGVPNEVLASIFAHVSTKDRRADRVNRPSPSTPKPRLLACPEATFGTSQPHPTRCELASRGQHLPLVCRQWRTVLKNPGVAWRRLHLHWAFNDAVCNSAVFGFSSRTRCVEVRASRCPRSSGCLLWLLGNARSDLSSVTPSSTPATRLCVATSQITAIAIRYTALDACCVTA